MSISPFVRTTRELRGLARHHQDDLVAERGMSTEAQVLDVINELLLLSTEPRLSVKEITTQFTERYGDDYERKITNRWIGGILRKKLGLKPYKSDGTFVIALSEKTTAMLNRLASKYGISFAGTRAEPSEAGSRVSAISLESESTMKVGDERPYIPTSTSALDSF